MLHLDLGSICVHNANGAKQTIYCPTGRELSNFFASNGIHRNNVTVTCTVAQSQCKADHSTVTSDSVNTCISWAAIIANHEPLINVEQWWGKMPHRDSFVFSIRWRMGLCAQLHLNTLINDSRLEQKAAKLTTILFFIMRDVLLFTFTFSTVANAA